MASKEVGGETGGQEDSADGYSDAMSRASLQADRSVDSEEDHESNIGSDEPGEELPGLNGCTMSDGADENADESNIDSDDSDEDGDDNLRAVFEAGYLSDLAAQFAVLADEHLEEVNGASVEGARRHSKLEITEESAGNDYSAVVECSFVEGTQHYVTSENPVDPCPANGTTAIMDCSTPTRCIEFSPIRTLHTRGLSYTDACQSTAQHQKQSADSVADLMEDIRNATTTEELDALLVEDRALQGFEDKDIAYTTVYEWCKESFSSSENHRAMSADPDFDLRLTTSAPMARCITTIALSRGHNAEALLQALDANAGFLEAPGTRITHDERAKHNISCGQPSVVGCSSSSLKSDQKDLTDSWMYEASNASYSTVQIKRGILE